MWVSFVSYKEVLNYVSGKEALDEFIEYLEDIDLDAINKGFSEISDEIATRLVNGNKNSLISSDLKGKLPIEQIVGGLSRL